MSESGQRGRAEVNVWRQSMFWNLEKTGWGVWEVNGSRGSGLRDAGTEEGESPGFVSVRITAGCDCPGRDTLGAEHVQSRAGRVSRVTR